MNVMNSFSTGSDLYKYDELKGDLRLKYPDIDYARIAGAYRDIFIFEWAIKNTEKYFKERSTKENLQDHFSNSMIASANLKALYLSSSIFFKILNHEITGRSTVRNADYSITSLIKKNKIKDRKIFNIILPAYCVEIYRNKIIAHQEKYRIGGSIINKDGITKLHPISFQMKENKNEIDDLLTEIFSNKKIGSFEKESFDYYNNLDTLFQECPLIDGDELKISRQRLAVDNLVELIGCQSMTATEIVTAVNSYIFTVIYECEIS